MTVFILLFLVSLPILLTLSQDEISNRCVLPSYPAHGGYVVGGNPNAVPGQTFDTVRLNITCRPGFKVVGKDFLLCIDGFWSQKVPECVRSCRLDKHRSVKYSCVINGNSSKEGFRDCDLNEIVGTVVKPECNAPNYYRSGVLSNMRCTNSGWDYVAVCIPECGRVTSKGRPYVAGGEPAEHGEIPWHAGIYTKTSTPFKQICGGSLVSTTVVISAAHCFWDYQGQKLKKASRYAAAVGKMYRPWGDPRDVDAQLSDVKEIKAPTRFQGPSSRFQDDIAVVVLATTIVYQTYVRPVCMDFNHIFEKRQLQPGKFGKVAGWGLTSANGPFSPVLRVLDTPYVDIGKCFDEAPPDFKEFITRDKICAGHKDGKAICQGDSGGGLVFPAVDRGIERYYLRGVASTAPRNDDACYVFEIASYTQITKHTSFIEENTALFHGEIPNRNGSRINNFCVLPQYPKHGRYVVKGEPKAYPGQAFATVELDVLCDPGYAVENNVTLVCSEGWWSDEMPRCDRLCKLDRYPSIQYRCLTNVKNDTRECNNEEAFSTKIKPECKAPYFSREELPHMTCVVDKWDSYPAIRACRQDCGRISPEATGRLPWHATIYAEIQTNGAVEPKCAGTLISHTAVISDGQCIKENNLENLHHQFIAFGNQYHKWMNIHDHHAQYYTRYASTTFANFNAAEVEEDQNELQNVCVFKLGVSIKFTPHVSPVCLDFDSTFDAQQLQLGAVGKVSSWDIGYLYKTLNLLFVNVSVHVEPESYWSKLKKMFFADGVVDDSSRPCSLDRGTGFAIADTESDVERYYLRGVVTWLPNENTFCTSSKTLGIAHLNPHKDQIKRVLSNNYNNNNNSNVNIFNQPSPDVDYIIRALH